MTNGAPQDASEHVSATLVRRIDAIGEQEVDGARVVGKHPVRRTRRPAVVWPPHDLDCLGDDGLEQVGVEVGGHVLHHRRDALEAGARIDRRLRERVTLAVGLLVELHEDEIPDLEELPLLAQRDELVHAGGTLPPSPVPLPPNVDQNLGARSARPRVPHLPEVVLVAQAKDAAVRDAGDLTPEFARFIIGMVHGDIKAVGVDAEPLAARHPFPGVLDRFLLEVIAEREVAEHLEEGVVARGVTDLLEVVMLSTRPDALLAGHRTRVIAAFQTLKHPLELHHAGVGEQQCGVVRGHERRARHLTVRARRGFEVVQELAADIGGLHAGKI